jgi:hypothetical protein
MTQRYHLCLKRLSRPEEADDHPLEQIQELEHLEFMARFGPSRQADGICDRDRGVERALSLRERTGRRSGSKTTTTTTTARRKRRDRNKAAAAEQASNLRLDIAPQPARAEGIPSGPFQYRSGQLMLQALTAGRLLSSGVGDIEDVRTRGADQGRHREHKYLHLIHHPCSYY